MSTEENKALIRRYFGGDLNEFRTIAKEFLAPEFVAHHSVAGDMNYDQYMALYEGFFAAFPDMKYTIINIIAEGDKVAVQSIAEGTHKGEFQGIMPTGKRIKVSAFGIYKIAGGKFVENWGLVDSLSFMQQLGVAPPIGPGGK